MGFSVEFFRYQNLHWKDHAVDAVDALFLHGHRVCFVKLQKELDRFFLPYDRDCGVCVEDIFIACGFRFVQACVRQCLVKCSGVQVIAWGFVLKNIISQKEVRNVISDHDVRFLLDHEQVDLQGHFAQIVLPLIGQVIFVFP